MKFILDHFVPRPPLRYLEGYDVHRAGQLGWAQLENGKLLAAAEASGYDALITVDKGFAEQQNMTARRISVILLDTRDTDIDGLIPLVPALIAAMEAIEPGTFTPVRPA
jgi:hypothetical protein